MLEERLDGGYLGLHCSILLQCGESAIAPILNIGNLAVNIVLEFGNLPFKLDALGLQGFDKTSQVINLFKQFQVGCSAVVRLFVVKLLLQFIDLIGKVIDELLQGGINAFEVIQRTIDASNLLAEGGDDQSLNVIETVIEVADSMVIFLTRGEKERDCD